MAKANRHPYIASDKMQSINFGTKFNSDANTKRTHTFGEHNNENANAVQTSFLSFFSINRYQNLIRPIDTTRLSVSVYALTLTKYEENKINNQQMKRETKGKHCKAKEKKNENKKQIKSIETTHALNH